MESKKSNRIPINSNKVPLIVGLKWDEVQGQEIDLDLQCVLLNDLGQIEEAVYYNEQSSKISNIRLSEDSKGEKVGFDEVLTIDLNSCPFNIKYLVLMICSYKEQPLKFVESSQLQILQENATVFEYSIGSFRDDKTLACLPCIFEKSFEGTWSMVEVGIPGKGKTFLENESVIKEGLVISGFDMNLFLECKNWTGGKSFLLDKNQTLVIPSSLKSVTVGLGWDTRCDIDSSILLFDSETNTFENVYFGNKKNSSETVIHNGDNTTGIGSGDDETIFINLEKIPPNFKSIWAVITIYSSNYQFDDVQGAYCRLFSRELKSEFCRYNLSENKDGVSTGNIMCMIQRCREGQWSVSPKGFYTKNTQRSSQMVDIIRLLLKNDFSQVKILKPKEKVVAKKQEILGKSYEITVEKATGLAAFDSNGLSDPYVIIRVNGKQKGKTPIVKKNLNPIWYYRQTLQLVEGDRIEFRLFDHDFIVSDDYMGSGFVEVKGEVINSNKLTLELKVLNKDQTVNSKYTGNLSVIFTKLN